MMYARMRRLKMLDIRVCIPSYRRPKVESLEYFPSGRVYVDSEETSEYVRHNPHADIISCQKGIQGNLSRVRNHILDTEFNDGADAVLIIDDDILRLKYFEAGKRRHMHMDAVPDFLQKYTLIAQELGVYLWGLQVSNDKQNYRENNPFSLTCYIGGPFQCFLKGNTCRYDEELFLKEDYDMTLQQLNKYRKVLRLNKFYYEARQSEQTGGCATYRTLEEEKRQFELLQRKWGSNIVQREKHDRAHNKRKVRKREDYNPLIYIPIRGA